MSISPECHFMNMCECYIISNYKHVLKYQLFRSLKANAKVIIEYYCLMYDHPDADDVFEKAKNDIDKLAKKLA